MTQGQTSAHQANIRIDESESAANATSNNTSRGLKRRGLKRITTAVIRSDEKKRPPPKLLRTSGCHSVIFWSAGCPPKEATTTRIHMTHGR